MGNEKTTAQRWFSFPISCFSFLISLVFLVACSSAPAASESAYRVVSVSEGNVQVGQLAPTFVMRDPDGNEVNTAELQGKVLILNFWATWCAPCRAEMPEFEAAYQDKSSQGLEVYAVEIRASGNAEDSAQFLQEVGATFPNIRDDDALLEDAFIRQPAWPTTIMIDREGVVHHVQIGPITVEVIEAELAELGF